MNNTTDTTRPNANRIAVGAWFLLAGALLLLQEAGLLHVGGLGRLWPLLLVGLGVARLAVARERDGRRTAFWLLVVGGLFSFDHVLGYRVHHTWPLLVIAVGVSLVWDAFGKRREVRATTEDCHV